MADGSTARAILEFLDAPAAVSWSLAPEEALDYFQTKGLAQSFDYRDLIGEEHARAFTVAKMMDADLLADVQGSLSDALAKGIPFQEWADGITPLLQAKGWWGRQQVTDPLTGETILAALGSPSRLSTIYRTNMQAAYAAGAWDAIEANKDLAPFLLYDAIDDHRVRDEHAAWDGLVLEVDDAWWRDHYPPNGWNCRCSVIQLSADEVTDLGMAPGTAPPSDTVAWTNPRTGKTRQVPKGIDPGWDYNPGIERQKALAKLAKDKLKGYPDELAHAAAKGFDAAKAAGEKAALEAMAAIESHLANKTPHIAKALKQLQSTKAGQAMTPAELLAAAQAQAVKIETQNSLFDWKKAYLAGKTPSAKAQAAFDAMPEAERTALLAKLDADKAGKAAEEAAKQAAIQAEADAAAELLPYFETPASPGGQALDKVLAKLGPDGELGMTSVEMLALVKAELQAVEDAAGEAFGAMLAKSPGTLEAKAAAKALAGAQPGAKFVDLLANAQATVAAAKESQLAGQLKAATKKAMIGGKELTPAQAQFIGAMDTDDFAKLLAEVDAAKAAKLEAEPAPEWAQALLGETAQPVTAPATLNTAKLTQVGPQKGSNPGGLYRDNDTGETWYIKTPGSADHARNEVLASKLYQLAGIDVPELRLTTLDGKVAVASRIVDDLVKAEPAKLAKVAGARDGFAVDAWLANWDVAGATFDNLLVKGGKAIRVDTGGALRFRAQGGMKGQAWGDTVAELDSLRDAATNPQAAKVFGGMTKAELKASAERLLKIDRAQVDALVDQWGPLDDAERLAMKATLRARLDDIATRLGIKLEEAPPAPALRPGGKAVTAVDFDRIRESRANGYTISTDGGDIEDHQVLLQHYTGADGKARTRLVAKLRGEGAKRAVTLIQPKAGGSIPPVDLSGLRAKGLALAKSINSRAAKGSAWDETVATRLTDWWGAREDAIAQLKAEPYQANAAATLKALDEIHDAVLAWRSGNSISSGALKPIAKLDLDAIADVKPVAKPKAKGAAPEPIAWTQRQGFSYQLAEVDRGHMRETTASHSLPAVSRVLVGEGDGVRVRFIPDESGNSVSSRGLVHIDVDGNDLAAADRAIATLADLGVVTTRTTQGQRLGLYLDKLANLRGLKDAKVRDAWAKLDANYPDEAARNAAKLAWLNTEVGYDLTKSPHWNPDGLYQAFGHGRTLQMRPDLDGPAMAKVERETLVYTNVTGLSVGAGSDQWERLVRAIDGGGILSSQMDRARRGIAGTGSSVNSDHASGGANYVFTRLVGKDQKAAGVYFKPRILRRIDAFSYDGDRFGSVDLDVQRSSRAIDAEGFARNRGRHGNETNFRDGISLFDDLERIVFASQAEAKRAVADMRARGYTTWPDGRALDQVLQGPSK